MLDDHQHKLAEALEALERDPGDADAHLAAARAYLAESVTISAAGHLVQAEHMGAEAPLDWRSLGEAHLAAAELRPATAALDRALMGLPGDPIVRRLCAEAWTRLLSEGGTAPASPPLVVPARRAEIALFPLSCAPWDLLGCCLSFFIARWLADALEGGRRAGLVLPSQRGRPTRTQPELPDDSFRSGVATRMGASLGVWGEIVLLSAAPPRIHLIIAGLQAPGPAGLDETFGLEEGRVAAGVGALLGRALDDLLPKRAARRARADIDSLSTLSDEAFFDLVVIAEAGAKGRVEPALRVAQAASGSMTARAICERAARGLEQADPDGALRIARALMGAQPEDLHVMLLAGELSARADLEQAVTLLEQVADEGDARLETEALAILGRLDMEAGRLDAAWKRTKKALRLDKSHGLAHLLAAELSGSDGELDTMAKHLCMAMPRLTKTDREAAIDAASEALLAADKAGLLLEVASAATQDGKNSPTLAAAYAVGALRSDSGSVQRAGALLEAHLDAVLEEEVSAAIRSLFVETSCKAAVAAYQAGDLLDSLRRLERARETDPDHGPTRLALGEVLLSLNRAEEAFDVLKEAPALPGGGLRAWALLAVTLMRLGRLDDARIAAERAEHVAEVFPELAALYRA